MNGTKEMGDPGDETMKQVGTLNEIVAATKQDKNSCESEPEEVASWIVAIGRAIRAIFSF